MATQHLDLDEQESIAQLKYFWSRHGTWITALLSLILIAYAGTLGWNKWQSNLVEKSAVLYEEADRAFTAKDNTKLQQVFTDMKDRFAGTSYTVQAGFLASKSSFELQQWDAAAGHLKWVMEHASDKAHQDLAALRLAAVWVQATKLEEAVAVLKRDFSEPFKGLAADRMGDVYALQNKETDAVQAYQRAASLLEKDNPYRLMVDVKLARLGIATASVSTNADQK